jgi:outer membrane protein assembly factor BamB
MALRHGLGDAQAPGTGGAVWVHDTVGDFWASPLVADGKVFIGSRKGDFWIMAAGREKKVLAALPELSLRIVEFAREHGRITMADAIRLTGSSRNTLKQHFRALVADGHLSLNGAGRGAWYSLR